MEICYGQKKFIELINWVEESGGIINKFELKYITKDNRFIIAKDDIEVNLKNKIFIYINYKKN